MKKHYWTSLQQGDLIDIVAPGMKPRPRTLQGIKSFAKSWGLNVRYSPEIIGKDLLCAQSKEFRFKDLKKALLAKDSKMVWCLRGGYGSLHLLESLNKVKAPRAKLFMGLSDVTSLHTFLNQQWGWSTIHGCNIDRFALKQATRLEQKRIHDSIFGKKQKVKYSLKALNDLAVKKGEIRSSFTGGNLVTLQSGFGTQFQIQTRNKILFFEDIGERAYRVDRVLEHMRQLKMFNGVKAIVFGQFTGGKEPGGKSLVPQLLKQFAQEQKVPVFSGLQSGHGKNQHPLPLNTSSVLCCEKQPYVEIEVGVKD